MCVCFVNVGTLFVRNTICLLACIYMLSLSCFCFTHHIHTSSHTHLHPRTPPPPNPTTGGQFAQVNTLEELKNLGWTSAKPLRVVTGYNGVARRFFEKNGFDHVVLLSADGALEAAPAMGSADIILDLVRCVGEGVVGKGLWRRVGF